MLSIKHLQDVIIGFPLWQRLSQGQLKSQPKSSQKGSSVVCFVKPHQNNGELNSPQYIE